MKITEFENLESINYESATRFEAINWMQRNLPVEDIKGNSHCSPKAKLLFFHMFKCFENYSIQSKTTETEMIVEIFEMKELKDGSISYLLKTSSSLPLSAVGSIPNDIKKIQTSLIGRALANMGILSRKELDKPAPKNQNQNGNFNGYKNYQQNGNNQGAQKNQQYGNNGNNINGSGMEPPMGIGSY